MLFLPNPTGRFPQLPLAVCLLLNTISYDNPFDSQILIFRLNNIKAVI